jgi:lipopolysaccharide transport system permease protein
VLSNTVFPIDLVPVKSVLISQVTMVVGMALVILAVIYLDRLTPMIILLPLFWALHMTFLVGLLWILSLVNLIFRDLQNFVGVLVMFLMIASPIAYTPEMVPSGLKPLLMLNPLAYFIVVYQDVLIFGRMPSLTNIVVIFVMSLGIFYLGGRFFTRAKRTLVDYA